MTITLYRGDLTMIESFEMSKASKHSLVGQGIYLTNNEQVATSRQAKKPMMESLGIPIHIWIDDNPEAILQGAESIWPNTAKEGEIVIPDHTSGELKSVSLKDMKSSVQKGECAVSKKLISRDILHFKHNQS